MAKYPKLYFKRGSTLMRLDKFKQSYSLVAQNWDIIKESYEKKNESYRTETDKVTKAVKSLFPKVPKLTVTKERFEELQKDLKIKDITISIYMGSTGGRLVELSARKDGEDLVESK